MQRFLFWQTEKKHYLCDGIISYQTVSTVGK